MYVGQYGMDRFKSQIEGGSIQGGYMYIFEAMMVSNNEKLHALNLSLYLPFV